ncbi:MAG: Smr/MutS family protein [Gemmatimonadales bacterium]
MATLATLEALEFARALDAVAAHALSAPGADRIRRRRPTSDVHAIRRDLTQVAELLALTEAGAPLSAERVEDIADPLDRLARSGGVPDGAELIRLAAAGRAARTVARELARCAEVAPAIAALRVEPVPADPIEAIERALDPDGQVRDGASRDVDRARRTVREVRAQLVRTLEGLLRGIETGTQGDATVTIRDGRYVLPVARDARGRVRGLVHGTSASGNTLFVEPEATVELGNSLIEAEAAEARAVQALLLALADGLRPHANALADGHAMCVAVDDACARARYAAQVRGAVPTVVPAPAALSLTAVRHPLLLADGVEAVPFDLQLSTDQLALVVSGPNTGGKTVLLKAIGVLVALTQAGVVAPVGAGTQIPVFHRLVADIGDRQSIAESLSTFSAHLAALREALAAAGPTTMVLLDEAGSGTDPTEGAALLAASVVHLVDAGTRVVLTTHLGRLKELANERTTVVNGSLQFDGERLAPTYRLLVGVPGRSYGLVMARRLAVPDSVVKAAEDRLSGGERQLDQMLAELETARRVADERAISLEMEAARLARDLTQVAEAQRGLAAREAALDQAERDVERRGREQARAFLLEARKRVEDALGRARAAVDEATAREARKLVEEGISAEAEALKKLAESKGWRVVERGEGRGETGDGRKNVSVRLPSPSPVSRTEVDLRGMRADEARIALEQALDAAVVDDLPVLYVMHGKGTGALKQVTTEVLSTDRRVVAHRVAPPQQGGAGVTVVELA